MVWRAMITNLNLHELVMPALHRDKEGFRSGSNVAFFLGKLAPN